MPANSFCPPQGLHSGFLLACSPLGCSSMADVPSERKVYFWLPSCSGTSCPRHSVATSIFWFGITSHPLASVEQAAAFHYKWVVVQHVQSRAVLTEQAKGVHNHLSCGTGARQGLRRSFKKYVFITDDLSEELPLLSHFFNQIWPALVSVQLGWLLCIQWQEKPDSTAEYGIWRTNFLLFLRGHFLSNAACANGGRNFFYLFFFFKSALLTWCPQWTQSFISWLLKIRPPDFPSRLNSPGASKMPLSTISILERDCPSSHLCGWCTNGPTWERWGVCV